LDSRKSSGVFELKSWLYFHFTDAMFTAQEEFIDLWKGFEAFCVEITRCIENAYNEHKEKLESLLMWRFSNTSRPQEEGYTARLIAGCLEYKWEFSTRGWYTLV